jgi:hypothetical protein
MLWGEMLHLSKLPFVDPKRIAVVESSQGGIVTPPRLISLFRFLQSRRRSCEVCDFSKAALRAKAIRPSSLLISIVFFSLVRAGGLTRRRNGRRRQRPAQWVALGHRFEKTQEN